VKILTCDLHFKNMFNIYIYIYIYIYIVIIKEQNNFCKKMYFFVIDPV